MISKQIQTNRIELHDYTFYDDSINFVATVANDTISRHWIRKPVECRRSYKVVLSIIN